VHARRPGGGLVPASQEKCMTHLEPSKPIAAHAPAWLAFAALLALVPPAHAQTQTAVEYYYAGWNHYFVTSFPDEIDALDGGAFGGLWKRTGEVFNVWSAPTGSSSPTCRFFSTAFDPRSSHFYTPFADECAILKTNPGWQFESVAFHVQIPADFDTDNAHCPTGTQTLYRLYNNGEGGAPNHRYTTSVATFNQMIAQGWSYEGQGNLKVFACVPPITRTTAEGLWDGKLANGANFSGVILDDGTYWFVYERSATDETLAGVMQGTGVSSNGTYTSTAGIDINFGNHTMTAGSLSGTYAPQSSFAGTVVRGGAPTTFTSNYVSDYDQPISLAAVAGTYSGLALTAIEFNPATVTVTASGALTGIASPCTYTGTVAPRGNTTILDVTIAFGGQGCSLAGTSASGIGDYDDVERSLFIGIINASRTDGALFVGTK
jgi:hypothetical protein